MPKVRRDAVRSHAAMPKLSACEEENTMSIEKRDFDREASKWDENPARSKLADDIVRAISKQIDLTDDMDVMDFGCGTGLLALRLQPIVRSSHGDRQLEGDARHIQCEDRQTKAGQRQHRACRSGHRRSFEGQLRSRCEQYDPSPYKGGAAPSGSAL